MKEERKETTGVDEVYKGPLSAKEWCLITTAMRSRERLVSSCYLTREALEETVRTSGLDEVRQPFFEDRDVGRVRQLLPGTPERPAAQVGIRTTAPAEAEDVPVAAVWRSPHRNISLRSRLRKERYDSTG